MMNTTDRKAEQSAEAEAARKAKRRAEQAAIVMALRTVLEGDEQLLGFTRGRIAGGWRGKLNVGPEAFFAPYVNIGMTERRVILQHIHPEDGRASEILPHLFSLSEIDALTFNEVETFGEEPSCRLTLRLHSDQHFRLRVEGRESTEDALALTEVFRSLVAARRAAPSPMQRTCAACGQTLDQPAKFCPYCGARQSEPAPEAPPAPAAAEAPESPPAAAAPESPAPPETTIPPQAVSPPVAPEIPIPSAPSGFAAPPAPPSDAAADFAPIGETAIFEEPLAEPPAPPAVPQAPAPPEAEMPAPSASSPAAPTAPTPPAPPEPIAPEMPVASAAPPETPGVGGEASAPSGMAAASPWEAWKSPAPEADPSATAHYEQPASEMLSDALTEAREKENADTPPTGEKPPVTLEYRPDAPSFVQEVDEDTLTEAPNEDETPRDESRPGGTPPQGDK